MEKMTVEMNLAMQDYKITKKNSVHEAVSPEATR